jgi:hypothetical protein
MIFPIYEPKGLTPEAHMDINLSNDDETMHPLEPDALATQKVPVGDDAGEKGATSAEPTAPGPIRSGMPEKSKASATDWVLVAPPTSRCGRKCLPPATKRSNPVPPADQVMTQVELPPYHGPHSPLDLVSIEIIFGHIFEAFSQISQAAAAGATPPDDNKPLKRFCRWSLKKVLVSRYSYIRFLYIITYCYSGVCYTAGHLMLMSHQKLLSRSLLMCWRHLLWLLLLLPLLWQE